MNQGEGPTSWPRDCSRLWEATGSTDLQELAVAGVGVGGWAVLLSCPVLGVKDGGGREAVAPTLPRPPWVRLASFVGRMRAVTAQV